jgi:hypothetical protein
MENLNGEVKCEKDEVIFLSRLSYLFLFIRSPSLL